MSILAADKQAVSVSQTGSAENLSVTNDYEKITLNSSKRFALGISGYTHEHFYLPEIKFAANADECIRKIHRSMDSFLQTDDRIGLNKLEEIMQNEGIASFYDDSVGMFYTNTYLFSPIEMQTKLHRGTDEIKVFHAGSGSRHFNNDLIIEHDLKLEDIITLIKKVYDHISQKDIYTGSEVSIFISNKSNGKFSEHN